MAPPKLGLDLLPVDGGGRVRFVSSEAPAQHRPQFVGDRNALRLLGDAVPEILHVQDALGRGHLLERSVHDLKIAPLAERGEPVPPDLGAAEPAQQIVDGGPSEARLHTR